MARRDAVIQSRRVLRRAEGIRAEGISGDTRQSRRDRPPPDRRRPDALPVDHVLGVVRCDPPVCGTESGAGRLLPAGQRVPPRIRADRHPLRRADVARRSAIGRAGGGPYGGWETVAFSSREPARIVIMSPMMLEAIRAPSPMTQPREITLSKISAAAPITLPSRTILLRTTAFPSTRADSYRHALSTRLPDRRTAFAPTEQGPR